MPRLGELQRYGHYHQCANRDADMQDQYMKWAVVEISGCFFEVLVTAMAIWMVWSLQTTFGRKFVVVALFAMRLPYA